ncbi:lipoprotein [Streptomyces lichenis]|uniref:Lipoprotein n=1 Tax=Streptomyces lichenis TaxID=2306967 RepID=A0ABT0IFP7_9ACTN|nr:lipoprotein [Streptomyces lichenis]MCK8680158.1 lipoprotein [Streptomyces lichenis]
MTKPIGDDKIDAMFRQGTLDIRCELDAKPAGHTGFLRVYVPSPETTRDTPARAALTAFVADEKITGTPRYTTPRLSGIADSAEVTYTATNEILGDKPERALAVTTPQGPVILHLGGLDAAEHTAMLPAYERAKRTMRVEG